MTWHRITAATGNRDSLPTTPCERTIGSSWTYDAGGGEIRLAVAGGTVYVGSDDVHGVRAVRRTVASRGTRLSDPALL